MATGLQRDRIESLRTLSREARRRAMAYAAGIAPVTVLFLMRVVATAAFVTAAAAALAAAGWHAIRASSLSAERRETLDELIVNEWYLVAADETAERARELTSRSHRSHLATAVLAYSRPTARFAPPMRFQSLAARRELVQHQAALERLAARLRDMSRPVDARGVVMVERMLIEIALPSGGRATTFAPLLALAERALEGER